MKAMYKANLILIIINVLLGFTIYFGLLFMIVTGTCQIIMYVNYLFRWKEVDKSLRKLFKIYGTTTALTLVTFFIGVNDHSLDITIPISMVMGAILAFFFLYISKKQSDYYSFNTENNELLNS